MAGGPILPSSTYTGDTAGRLFPNFYTTTGTPNAAPHDEGLGVMASLSANATWELRFPMPPSIPTGTLKLRLLALANASTGTANFQVWDAAISPGAAPSTATLTQETGAPTSAPASFGSVATGTYSANWLNCAPDDYGEIKIPLALAPTANQMVVLALEFQTSGFTLAQVSTWIPSLIWE